MISLKPNSGIVELKDTIGFEEADRGHLVTIEKTLNFNEGTYHYVKSETFQGTLAEANNADDDVPVVTEEFTRELVIPSEDVQDNAYELLNKLGENFVNTGKTVLPFVTWKQYKWFETSVGILFGESDDCYGSTNEWDVFVLPKYNMVFEIYYIWSGQRRVRKFRSAQLMPNK